MSESPVCRVTYQSAGPIPDERMMGPPHPPINANGDGAFRTHPPTPGDPFASDPAALPESEANLALVLDAANAGMLVWRVPEDRCDVDARMLALLGVAELHGTTLSDFIAACIHPDDAARLARAFARAAEAADACTINEDVRLVQPDRSVRWLSIIGRAVFGPVAVRGHGGTGTTAIRRAVRVPVMATEISERKQREAGLALLDQVSDACARLSSAAEIMQIVGARVGTYLRVPAVCLAEIDEVHDEIRILQMWAEEGEPRRPHVVRLSDFVSPVFQQSSRAGETIVVSDTGTDPRTDSGAHAALGVRAFLSVPFSRDGTWKFTLAACDSRPHVWRDDEAKLFRQLGERLFARLEHALAEQAVANDLRDTQLLRELSVRLVYESDTQAFFHAIVTAAMSVTGAKAGSLQLLDADTNDLALLAYHGFDHRLASRFARVTSASPTSCGQALATGRRAIVNFGNRDDEDESLRLIVDAGVRSAQSTPLVTRTGRTVGMLSTHWGEPHRLSEREVRFLDLLARQAAELIEWRRNQDALRDSERRLSAELADTQLLQRVSAQLIEEQGSEALYETLVDAATWIMRSDYASLQMLYPHKGARGELRLIASRNFDERAKHTWEWVAMDASTTCAHAMQTRARVVAADVTQCDFLAGTDDQRTLLDSGVRALQSTPLVSRGGRMLGVISTHWKEPHQPSERDYRLLDILARQAADLMERTQTEDALRRSEARLIEADRRKDEFLATLAHELRNPLAPLRTSLELIRIVNTPESIDEARMVMEEQVRVLVRLVDDLLEVSRITSGKIRLRRQPTPLASLMATVIQANRAALDAAGVTLDVDMPDTPVLLDADPPRFVQVVSNVLHNAIKFTDPGGRISVAAEVTQPGETGTREVIVTVTDSGVGIVKEMLPRVFDLFTQGDDTASRSSEGLGIGLSLARHLIEMHGGSIEAFSDGPGKGSTFTLRVPVSSAIADQTPVASPSVPPRINRRVVVIDDNPAAARALERLVRALGGECRVAHDGESGLDHIRQMRPDIVILDIGMPKIDGYETCRRIRQEFGSAVVIVALTGWGQERDKQRAMRAGFDVHLIKPADPIVLEELLATAGAREGASL